MAAMRIWVFCWGKGFCTGTNFERTNIGLPWYFVYSNNIFQTTLNKSVADENNMWKTLASFIFSIFLLFIQNGKWMYNLCTQRTWNPSDIFQSRQCSEITGWIRLQMESLCSTRLSNLNYCGFRCFTSPARWDCPLQRMPWRLRCEKINCYSCSNIHRFLCLMPLIIPPSSGI